jgi:alpha-L-fucosidase
VYLHIFAWPMQRLILPGLAGKVAYAQLLNDASEVMFSDTKPDESTMHPGMGGPAGSLTIQLPVQQPAVEVPVVELFLKRAAG